MYSVSLMCLKNSLEGWHPFCAFVNGSKTSSVSYLLSASFLNQAIVLLGLTF